MITEFEAKYSNIEELLWALNNCKDYCTNSINLSSDLTNEISMLLNKIPKIEENNRFLNIMLGRKDQQIAELEKELIELKANAIVPPKKKPRQN